jgi:hypothetical protein
MFAHLRSYALALRGRRNHVATVAYVRPEAWLVWFHEVGSEHLPIWRARDIGCRRKTEYSVMRTIKIRFFSWFSTRREAAVEDQPPLEHIAAQKDDLAQAGPNVVA